MSSSKLSRNLNDHVNNSNGNKHVKDGNSNNEQHMRPSTKRPRAPIACLRCHHKKVHTKLIYPLNMLIIINNRFAVMEFTQTVHDVYPPV